MSDQITIKAITLDDGIVAQDGPLAALQIALRDRLQEESHYSTGIEILYENSLDLMTEIDTAIAKLGICVIINTPSAEDHTPNVPLPMFDEVQVIAQVVENPLLNRADSGTRVPGGTVAWHVATDLCATSINGSLLIHKSEKQMIDEDAGNVIWNVEFSLSLNI